MAQDGREQSPIRLEKASFVEGGEAQNVEFWRVRTSEASIVNNGNSVQVDMRGGSELIVDGRRFQLVQFHFHSPAEHVLGDTGCDLELHLVHRNPATKKLAVFGVFFKIGGQRSSFLDAVFSEIPETHGKEKALTHEVLFDELQLHGYVFRYSGSLTTPPCSENVAWILQKNILSCTKDQVDVFRQAIPFENVRPVQDLNSRQISICRCAHRHQHSPQSEDHANKRNKPDASQSHEFSEHPKAQKTS